MPFHRSARSVPAGSENESTARAESLRASVGDGGLSALYIAVLEHMRARSFLCSATQLLYQSDEDLDGPQLHLPGK